MHVAKSNIVECDISTCNLMLLMKCAKKSMLGMLEAESTSINLPTTSLVHRVKTV